MSMSKLHTSELDIYSPTIGPPRTDYRQAQRLQREMIEEMDEKAKEEEEKVEEIDDENFIGSFPPVHYSYTFCDVAFLLHKLNQLAKRKQKENIKKKESCKSPDKSIESFSVDFVRLSALNLISAKFIEAMENSLEVQAKAVCCSALGCSEVQEWESERAEEGDCVRV